MTRFRSASDQQAPYSDLHPERFEAERYVPPQAGVARAVDDALEAEPARSVRANMGFAHMKVR
jgi:hypothetical protein